ncbi:hypothetical protein HYDPIDRAFT_117713 [Hydnomerulius pinastri MD-312]|uniref:Uncharacterized protein n=1 Tax=Hydnomerulius pinastri MD-312 TaxID=994086 RepID=A0A0C9WAA4_9AGAM|nr:hypothetical protein HYDPIDRAFT_117713 [Hydnomerulius pinastri MD-312]
MPSNYQKTLKCVEEQLDAAMELLEKNKTSQFLTERQLKDFRTRRTDLYKEYTDLRDQKPGFWDKFKILDPTTKLKFLDDRAQTLVNDMKDVQNTHREHALLNGSSPSPDSNATATTAPLRYDSSEPNTPPPTVLPGGQANASRSTLASNNTTYFQQPQNPQALQSTAGSSRTSPNSQITMLNQTSSSPQQAHTTPTQPAHMTQAQSHPQLPGASNGLASLMALMGPAMATGNFPHQAKVQNVIGAVAGFDNATMHGNTVVNGDRASYSPINHSLPPMPMVPPSQPEENVAAA